MKAYKVFSRSCIFYFPIQTLLIFSLLTGCKSSTNDSVTPTGTTTGSITPSRFTNYNGYLTAELNGKLIEIGLTSDDELKASSFTGVYTISGLKSGANLGDHETIEMTIATAGGGLSFDTNTLKGIHKSGDKINGKLAILYSTYFNYYGEDWYATDNCTIEITSFSSPWIEGTFSADNLAYSNRNANASTVTPKAAIVLKKGMFKIRYK